MICRLLAVVAQLALISGSLSVALAAEPSQKSLEWPELPTTGFVKGRAATEADVAAESAVFVARVGDEIIGKPLKIDVPQYAIHTDVETGAKVAGLVIQAEAAQGQKLIGFLVLHDQSFLVGTLSEFKLLGTKKPTSPPPQPVAPR
jgi:hypothetical protein